MDTSPHEVHVFIPDVVNEEHVELRATVRRLLETRSPETSIRAAVDSERGYDLKLWVQMAGQLGLLGLGLPESVGGAGYGPRETTIVFEELGRALVPSPFFATVALAAQLLVAIDDTTANTRYLPAIAAGQLVATVALAERSGSWTTSELSDVMAVSTESDWLLTGEKTMVLNADAAGLILVVLTADSGTSVYAVDPSSAGVTIVALSTLDLTRRQSKVRFDGAKATLVGGHGAAAPAVAAMLDLASVALAAEQAGAAARLMEMSIEYAKLRQQFGRPIGAFQAVKHKLADMAFDMERMDSLVRHAATAAAAGSPDLPAMAAMAKVFCSEAFFRIAAETIQIHGGIGFTWEHPAHLYFRRAKSSEYLLGSPARHRENLLAALGV
jgi:alkylation response protein AidB-like acyl-CoA dehydrogenase